jgi:hypothetical protein
MVELPPQGLQRGLGAFMGGPEAEKGKFGRRITVYIGDEVQHYPIVQIGRTSMPDNYRLYIDSSAGTWLRAGSYDATIDGKERVSGSLGIIDYTVTNSGIQFVGLLHVRKSEKRRP